MNGYKVTANFYRIEGDDLIHEVMNEDGSSEIVTRAPLKDLYGSTADEPQPGDRMSLTKKVIASVLVVFGCIAFGMLGGLIIAGMVIIIPVDIIASGLGVRSLTNDTERALIMWTGFAVSALLYYICMTQYIWTKDTP